MLGLSTLLNPNCPSPKQPQLLLWGLLPRPGQPPRIPWDPRAPLCHWLLCTDLGREDRMTRMGQATAISINTVNNSEGLFLHYTT